jgi:galactokinase
LADHVDYNQGAVLPIAIDRFVHLAARPRADDMVTIESLDTEKQAAIQAEDLDQRVDARGKALAGLGSLSGRGAAWRCAPGAGGAWVDAVLAPICPLGRA